MASCSVLIILHNFQSQHLHKISLASGYFYFEKLLCICQEDAIFRLTCFISILLPSQLTLLLQVSCLKPTPFRDFKYDENFFI